jgi:hypothetical protein
MRQRVATAISAATVFALVSCGGSDAPTASTLPSVTTEARPAETREVFTEVGSEADGGAANPADDTTVALGTGGNTGTGTNETGTNETGATGGDPSTEVGPSTTVVGQPSTNGQPAAPTTTIAGAPTTVVGGAAPTTVLGQSAAFNVTTGTTDVDGTVEPTSVVQARPGASGEVRVSNESVIQLTAPGPTEWDLSAAFDDLDGIAFEYLEVDEIPDGAGDPFAESGGATIITLRALQPGQSTLVIEPLDGPEAPITVRVSVG